MFNLFRFEYRRLFRRISLYICIGILLMMVMYGLFLMTISILSEDLDNIFAMTAYQMVSFTIAMSNITIITAVFTSIFVCEDRSKGTIKTIRSLGYPRYQLFLAKYAASATATAIMVISSLMISILCAAVVGADFNPVKNTTDFPGMGSLFGGTMNVFVYAIYEFTVIMACHSLYFMVSELVGKTGLSIVINIFGPGLIYIILAVLYGFVYTVFVSLELQAVTDVLEQIAVLFTMYWLPTSITTLFISLMGTMDDTGALIGVFVNIGYILLFGGLALLITSKKQVKN